MVNADFLVNSNFFGISVKKNLRLASLLLFDPFELMTYGCWKNLFSVSEHLKIITIANLRTWAGRRFVPVPACLIFAHNNTTNAKNWNILIIWQFWGYIEEPFWQETKDVSSKKPPGYRVQSLSEDYTTITQEGARRLYKILRFFPMWETAKTFSFRRI